MKYGIFLIIKALQKNSVLQDGQLKKKDSSYNARK